MINAARLPHPRYLLLFAVLITAFLPLWSVLPLDEAAISAFDLAAIAFVFRS